jgi:hypothetical protein
MMIKQANNNNSIIKLVIMMSKIDFAKIVIVNLRMSKHLIVISLIIRMCYCLFYNLFVPHSDCHNLNNHMHSF